MGRSERSLQRWAAGTVQNIPPHARGVLARASVASRNRDLIQELGGVRRTAEITGRSVRTVQRWASGAITTPLADARRMLQRADAAVRMRAQGINVDPATGRPRGPVFLQMKGEIRINLSRNDGYHYPSRQIGTSEADQISPEIMAQLVDALGQGDIAGRPGRAGEPPVHRVPRPDHRPVRPEPGHRCVHRPDRPDHLHPGPGRRRAHPVIPDPGSTGRVPGISRPWLTRRFGAQPRPYRFLPVQNR